MNTSVQPDRRAARRGRPPGDPATVRSERVVTFLTREQMQLLRAQASGRGLSISALCAELLGRTLVAALGSEPDRGSRR